MEWFVGYAESGHVIKPSNGWYQNTVTDDEKKFRTKDTYTKEFWLRFYKTNPLLSGLLKDI